jgi:hypothetical protein
MLRPSPCPGNVADYLGTLAHELRFDPSLSRRVLKEVEDHLWEAAANEAGDAGEVQLRAIARFGDAREIARQYAALSILGQIRRVAIVVVLALCGIFIAMKGRVAWYGLMQWELSDQTRSVAATVVPVTRAAFMTALVIGLIGCAYVIARRAPMRLDRAYCRQIKRSTMFCMAAACALLASVAVDMVLTALRLLEGRDAAAALIPVMSAAAEMALLGTLFRNIRLAIRRTELVSGLLHPM